MTVSIVIPIYKVEQYVERCLASVLQQEYRQIEVILVDDCTPDHSMEVARAYIEKSPKSRDLSFKYVSLECNRGASAARNKGIEIATGEYIFFLDSDDEITPDSIALLVEPLKQHRYDFVTGYYEVRGDMYPPQKVVGAIMGVSKIAESYGTYQWHCMIWNKLCRRQYLLDNELFFKEGTIYEDELWSALIACTAKSMYAVNKNTYIYYIREGSVMTAQNMSMRLSRLKLILRSFYEYLSKRGIWFNEISGVESLLKRYVYNQMREEGNGDYAIYASIRECDVRSFALKNRIYSTLKERILNLDKYMPAFLGYPYTKLIGQYWRVKERLHSSH